MNDTIEQKKCWPVHKWGGAIIVINAEVMEVQYPQLVGAPCDCGKFTWHEESCGCAGNPYWASKPKENTNE